MARNQQIYLIQRARDRLLGCERPSIGERHIRERVSLAFNAKERYVGERKHRQNLQLSLERQRGVGERDVGQRARERSVMS